jgi:hypothetical protein
MPAGKPRFASAKNVGNVVRQMHATRQMHEFIEVDAASNGDVQDLLVMGSSMGVSRLIPTPLSHS